MSHLRINISKLSEGIHRHNLEARPDEIGLDERFIGIVHVSASLEKTSRQMFLRVECTTAGLFSCDRCLDDFRKDIRASYTIMYTSDRGAAEGLKEREVQILSPDANTIDLTEDLREYMLLAVPLKVLCREECAGLCPVCGVNWNHSTCRCAQAEIDSRWDGLKRFLEN